MGPFKRMVLNIIGRNQDDHTKNITFILKQGKEWVLSPAYDVTHSYNPEGDWTSSHQMTMNGKEDHFIEEDFKKVADSIQVNNWKEIVLETLNVVGDWPNYAKTAGVKKTKIIEVGKSHRLNFNFSKK